MISRTESNSLGRGSPFSQLKVYIVLCACWGGGEGGGGYEVNNQILLSIVDWILGVPLYTIKQHVTKCIIFKKNDI